MQPAQTPDQIHGATPAIAGKAILMLLGAIQQQRGATPAVAGRFCNFEREFLNRATPAIAGIILHLLATLVSGTGRATPAIAGRKGTARLPCPGTHARATPAIAGRFGSSIKMAISPCVGRPLLLQGLYLRRPIGRATPAITGRILQHRLVALRRRAASGNPCYCREVGRVCSPANRSGRQGRPLLMQGECCNEFRIACDALGRPLLMQGELLSLMQ